MQPNATRHIDAIQALRAFAALLVALGHMLHEVASMKGGVLPPPSLFQDWTGAGVDIFFVISGFVMVYASQRLFAAPGGARLFLTRRIARIVPLYWLMTSIFLGVMLLLPSALASAAPSWGDILKSYFFIPYVRADQEFMQPVYKLGWTLNYEMFFYAVFALVIALPMRRAVLAIAVIFTAIVAAGQYVQPASGILSFWSQPIILEFVWGAGLALLALRGIVLPRAAAWALIMLGLSGFALWSQSGIDPYGPLRPFVWGAASALMVAGAAFMPRGKDGALNQALVTLGDASYAIYLLHPMVVRALRIVWDKAGLAPVLPGPVYIITAMVLTLLASVTMYRWFEKPLTRFMQRMLGAAKPQDMPVLPAAFGVPASRTVHLR